MAGEQGAGFTHRQDVLTILNRDLANEMNTMLMYMANSLLAKGVDAGDVKEMAGKFARQDFEHVKILAERIVDLEGMPELAPAQVQNNASIEARMPAERHREIQPMLKNALESEMQSVIEYKKQIQDFAFSDPSTRLLLEEILVEKEHQAEEIRGLLGV